MTALLAGAAAPAVAQTSTAEGSVYLDDLTSPEVRSALQTGRTTIIIPIGGTEQNGPHMALGKHNARAHVLAGRIAAALGDALVAPVVAYVPEGRVNPPTEHMRYAGTISIPEDAFAAVLQGAARSFKQHGFTNIVFLGDSGNYQSVLASVAAGLNREWAAGVARAHHVALYYRTVQTDYVAALKAHGLTDAQIGTHAGAADTALTMALAPTLVRTDRLAQPADAGKLEGVSGDPRAATAALGAVGANLVVTRTVQAIRALAFMRR